MVYVLEGLNSLVLNYCSTTVDTNATDALALSWLPAKMLVCIAWRQPQELSIFHLIFLCICTTFTANKKTLPGFMIYYDSLCLRKQLVCSK